MIIRYYYEKKEKQSVQWRIKTDAEAKVFFHSRTTSAAVPAVANTGTWKAAFHHNCHHTTLFLTLQIFLHGAYKDANLRVELSKISRQSRDESDIPVLPHLIIYLNDDSLPHEKNYLKRWRMTPKRSGKRPDERGVDNGVNNGNEKRFK